MAKPSTAATLKRRPAPEQCTRCAEHPEIKRGGRECPVPQHSKTTDTQSTYICPDCKLVHVVAHAPASTAKED